MGLHMDIAPVRYALVQPIATSRGPISVREGFRVFLTDKDGVTGIGETLPLAAFGTETTERCHEALRALAHALVRTEGDLETLLDGVEREAPDTPAARCGIDFALHDLVARVEGLSVAALLATLPATRVAVNGVGEIDPARGYGTWKVKVGARDLADDIRRVGAARKKLGPAVRLRIDANGAWSPAAAAEALEALAPFDLELVEQPVAPDALDDLARLAASAAIPVAADESLALPEGRARLVAGELAPIAILKPLLLGGLRRAFLVATAARARGVVPIVTGTFDGPCGTAAALHLAAACADPAYACGLAAADLVRAPFPPALVPERGFLEVPGSAAA